jgi:acyl-CoA synthetase (AMP-forming)/AMP-acid ligase II
VVFAADAAERVAGAVAGLDAPPLLIDVRGGEGDGSVAWERLADGQSTEPLQQARGDDVMYVGYTSGTTGRPRGVVLDQAACWRAAHLGASNWNMVPYGATVLTGSLSFTAVLCSMVWSTIARGAALVLCTPFDVERAVWAVERYAGTFVYLPTPAIPEGTAALRSAPALDRLVTIATGASPIPPDTLGALVEVGGRRVLQAYGLTEASGIPLCIGRRDDWLAAPAGYATAGRVVGPTVFGLRDRAGEAVAHDGETVGEIAIASPTLMRGYWRDPEATAQTLRDGWLHTTDLATIDGDGFVVIRGRSKDTIVSGGINVYPAEIEAVLAASPRIRESAVVGAPHERWGETVVAFVVAAGPEPDAGLADHVRDHCRAHLAHYKTPTRVEVLAELPRNPNGKVLKDALRGRLDAP